MDKRLGRAFKRIVENEEEVIAQTRKVKTKRSLFMNDTRRGIFAYLCRFPCSHLRKIGREVGRSPPTIKWHLTKLKKAQIIDSERIGKTLVFYPIGMLEPEDVSVAALLNRQKARRIVHAISDEPGTTQQELCEALGIGSQAVRWFATQLEDEGVIESVVDGRYRRYYLTELIATKIEESRKRRKFFRESVLRALTADGVDPELVHTSPTSMTVRVRTGEGKHSLKIVTEPFSQLLAQV